MVSLALALALAGSTIAQDIHWWTNAGGDGMWNRDTAPYNWERAPAWNPDGPRTPCPPPPHRSASIWISGNPTTRSSPLVIPAGYTADCTYGEDFGTIFGPEWGLHLDIYGSLTYRWYLVLAQGLEGLTDPSSPDDDPNRSVVNMYSGSRIHGTNDSPGNDKSRAEGIAIGTNWWAPLPYVTMNMYEGSECLLNWAWIGGHLNMYGGTFDVLAGVNMGIGTPENVPDNLIRVDIHEGRLILPSDFADEVQDWIDRGILKAYGMTPGLPRGPKIVVDTTTISGRTIVTALPTTPQASQPNPPDGATDVRINPVLRWLAGANAGRHEVYFGTSEDDVENASNAGHPGVTLAEVDDSHFDPGFLEASTSYFWRVDEVNDTHPDALWKGPVWSFTTGTYIVVDDFESYTNSSPNRVFQTWIDGAGFSPDQWFPNGHPGNGSGSLVGYDPVLGDIMETGIVHGGRQSMPMDYDNTVAPRYSQAERTFTAPQDWSRRGVTTLTIYFRGALDNAAAPLYVRINDAEELYDGGTPATTVPVWKQWNIDLASVRTDLASVKTLVIGVGDGIAGGTGTLYIDDILLYATAPEVVTPADPGSNGLAALYAMEGDVQDSSGKGRHGTPSGAPMYVQGQPGFGQAMSFDGVNDYVDLPIGALLSTLTSSTFAAWVDITNVGNDWQRVFDFGTDTTSYMFLTPYAAGRATRFAIRTASVGEQPVSASRPLKTGWHHMAVVIDGASMTLALYQDGTPVATAATTLVPKDLGNPAQSWLGRSQYMADPYLMGSLDEFCIYNRALSESEIRYLAGDR